MKKRSLSVLAALLLAGLLPAVARGEAGGTRFTASVTASAAAVRPGGEFTVTIGVTGEPDAAQVILTYDEAAVEYVERDDDRLGAFGGGRIVILDFRAAVSEGVLRTLRFRVKDAAELGERTEAVFTITQAKFSTSVEAMTGSAEDAALDPASVTVDIAVSAFPVRFADENGTVLAGYPVSVPRGACVGEVPELAVPDGYTLVGWRCGSSVLSAGEIRRTPVTAAVTYVAQLAITGEVRVSETDYVGGCVRVLLTGAELGGYTLNGRPMFRLGEGTFAILCEAETLSGVGSVKPLIRGAEADEAHDIAAFVGTGDVNRSGDLDITDARAIFNCQNVPADVNAYMDVCLLSDLNADGVVDVDDVSLSLERIAETLGLPIRNGRGRIPAAPKPA